MGQTLTHGVYLPDEGERNCYSGLASNWSILDGAVGTIAEHTSAFQTNYYTKDIVINSETAANTQSALSGSKIKQIVFNDSNNSNYFFRFRQYVDASSSRMQFNAQGFDSNNQAYSSTFVYRINSDGNSVLYPGDNNQSLGTANNKWKTLNGINPGALSLPKIVAKNTANIASAIVGSDGETQYLDGTDNYYIAALDGWISICIAGFTQDNKLWITVYDTWNETWGTSAESSTSDMNALFVIFPIRANQLMRIRMKCTSVIYARFYPCEGNV